MPQLADGESLKDSGRNTMWMQIPPGILTHSLLNPLSQSSQEKQMSKSQVEFHMPVCGEPCLLILPDGREIEIYGDDEGLHLGSTVDLMVKPSPIGGMCFLISYGEKNMEVGHEEEEIQALQSIIVKSKIRDFLNGQC